MKLINYEQRTPEWHEARNGVITGTGLKKILGTPKVRENYFYEILAERLSIESNDEESALDRGVRLEEDCVKEFEQSTKLKVERKGLCLSDTSKWIGNSPDGLINISGKYSKALECKCLSSANHVRAYVTQEIPEEYIPQGIQYFCVNDDLEELYFAFYDPRISKIPFFTLTMKRSEYKKQIDEAVEKQKQFIEEINKKLNEII